ncbi:Imm50 family immunity protein [Streptomyces sp. NBC_01261]|uniref:Imm50 family immunity protein n=1 Tax=Streptomyces sp. NBC_01261 TaxID=2903802 RepID=UPI003FCE0D8B
MTKPLAGPARQGQQGPRRSQRLRAGALRTAETTRSPYPKPPARVASLRGVRYGNGRGPDHPNHDWSAEVINPETVRDILGSPPPPLSAYDLASVLIDERAASVTLRFSAFAIPDAAADLWQARGHNAVEFVLVRTGVQNFEVDGWSGRPTTTATLARNTVVLAGQDKRLSFEATEIRAESPRRTPVEPIAVTPLAGQVRTGAPGTSPTRRKPLIRDDRIQGGPSGGDHQSRPCALLALLWHPSAEVAVVLGIAAWRRGRGTDPPHRGRPGPARARAGHHTRRERRSHDRATKP